MVFCALCIVRQGRDDNISCAFFMSVVVPWPIGICVLNQLTIHSIQFNSRCCASLPGETTSVLNHFKSPCQSQSQKQAPRVVNLVKKTHTQISGKKYIYAEQCLCIVQSLQRAQHVK